MNEVDHTARAHSELGGSTAERWRIDHCPASVRLSRGIPNEETPAARKGTAAHEVAHMCLVNNQDATEYVGRTVNGVEVDEGMADGVQVYLDDCRSLRGQFLENEFQYEVAFDLAELNPPVPMFSIADFVAYHPLHRKLYVKDYKNGFVYVDAVGNWQLRYCALGALLNLGPGKPVSEIEVTICQPNALGADLKRETFDAVELIEWSADLMASAWLTQDPAAPARAGEWCMFCPANGSCQTRAASLLAAAQIEFGEYGKLPEARLMTPAERGAIHAAASNIRALLKAVAEDIQRDPSGTGWKAVQGDGKQVWRDKAEAAALLSMDYGVDPFEPQEVVSPAVARGLVKDAVHAQRVAEHTEGKKPTKKAAEESARELLAPLLTRTSSGAILVPDADPRPAISDGAEFDGITE